MGNQVIEQAIKLRKSEEYDQALALLLEPLKETPLDPDINYQVAWTYDVQGKEVDAVFYYEAALSNGLQSNDRRDAMLALGSTYRCLGNYIRSSEILKHAIIEFPDYKPLKAFSAITNYNLKNYNESIKELLMVLLDTTSDEDIRSYDEALRFYADHLD